MSTVFKPVDAAFIPYSAPLVCYLQTQRFFYLKTPPVTFLRVQRVPGEGSAAGLRPFLHGGTEGKGRPFNVGSACTSVQLNIANPRGGVTPITKTAN